MLFHVTHTHHYNDCIKKSVEKQKAWNKVFFENKNSDIEFLEVLVCRINHKSFIIVEADSVQAIESAFEPIMTFGNFEIMPVSIGKF